MIHIYLGWCKYWLIHVKRVIPVYFFCQYLAVPCLSLMVQVHIWLFLGHVVGPGPYLAVPCLSLVVQVHIWLFLVHVYWSGPCLAVPRLSKIVQVHIWLFLVNVYWSGPSLAVPCLSEIVQVHIWLFLVHVYWSGPCLAVPCLSEIVQVHIWLFLVNAYWSGPCLAVPCLSEIVQVHIWLFLVRVCWSDPYSGYSLLIFAGKLKDFVVPCPSLLIFVHIRIFHVLSFLLRCILIATDLLVKAILDDRKPFLLVLIQVLPGFCSMSQPHSQGACQACLRVVVGELLEQQIACCMMHLRTLNLVLKGLSGEN